MERFSKAGGLHHGARVTASICALPIVAVLLTAPGSIAHTAMDTEIEHIVSAGVTPLVSTSGAGGVAVAVQMSGKTTFYNYGLADKVERVSINADSLFNIGSVRKVLEATLLSLGVERGEIKLDDPVNKYVGELQGDYISKVTIGELATHTSGLLLPSDHPPWPTKKYSLAGFLDALNAWKPENGVAPGKQRIYTHAGYILLQLALERRYHTPIAALLDDRVIKPLGMKSTLVPPRGANDRAMLTPHLLQRAVQGYAKSGEPIGVPGNQQGYFDFPGTGQMFSSARDLAILVAASLGDSSTAPKLRDALQLTQHEAFRIDDKYAQAMAWEISNSGGVTIVDKPGGLNNASAYVGIVPARKLGVVILSNRGDTYPHEAARTAILPALARLQL